MIDIYALAKNPLVFQKQRTITSAYIDVSGKMGIAQTVLMVQDNFTENFGAIKQDNFCVHEKGAYWVIYKAKFKFFQRPFWRDKVVTTSFPADNAPIRTYENTAITTLEGEPITLAVQEACCLDLERHRPVKLSAVNFPVEGAPEPFMDSKFTKFPVEPAEYVEVYRQKVLPQHIDILFGRSGTLHSFDARSALYGRDARGPGSAHFPCRQDGCDLHEDRGR